MGLIVTVISQSHNDTNLSPVIDIHGGAFMLGHSRMVSLPQIDDCLERGWIVLVPNHRLCPGVNLLEGPIQDIRDLLSWVHDGYLDAVLKEQGPYGADLENIAAFGTSSGGTLALALVRESRPISFITGHYRLHLKTNDVEL